MMIEVIDDFLDPGYYGALEERVFSPVTPWFCTPSAPGDKVGMSHAVYDDETQYGSGNLCEFMQPMFYMINSHIGTYGVIKARLESITETAETDHVPHVDTAFGQVGRHHKTAIFSFSDCAYTRVYNETQGPYNEVNDFTLAEEIESVRNRLIIIDGDRFHSGPTEVTCPRRIILNINFYTTENRIR